MTVFIAFSVANRFSHLSWRILSTFVTFVDFALISSFKNFHVILQYKSALISKSSSILKYVRSIAIFILWFNYFNANERFVSRSYLYDDSLFVSCTFLYGCYCSKIGVVFVLCRKETITCAIEFGYRQDRSEEMLASDLRFVKFKIYKILKDHAYGYAIVRDTLQSF